MAYQLFWVFHPTTNFSTSLHHNSTHGRDGGVGENEGLANGEVVGGEMGDGEMNNGRADNGGADNGGTDNGGTENGGTDNGGTDNGGTENGGTDNGGADNGEADNGGTDNGVATMTARRNKLKDFVSSMGVVVATRGGDDDYDDLTLHDVSQDDVGRYTCVVANDNGVRGQSMWLSIGG